MRISCRSTSGIALHGPMFDKLWPGAPTGANGGLHAWHDGSVESFVTTSFLTHLKMAKNRNAHANAKVGHLSQATSRPLVTNPTTNNPSDNANEPAIRLVLEVVGLMSAARK